MDDTGARAQHHGKCQRQGGGQGERPAKMARGNPQATGQDGGGGPGSLAGGFESRPDLGIETRCGGRLVPPSLEHAGKVGIVIGHAG